MRSRLLGLTLLVLALAAVAGAIRMLRPATAPPIPEWSADSRIWARDQRQLTTALGRAPRIWEGAKGPDIVVIVLDTTRLDRLGIYGYDQNTTPKLDAWARGARVYDQFRADATWTLPSHASLFTGKAPTAHGADGLPLEAEQPASPLRKGVPTVARSLRKAGYRTVGIAANRAFLDPAWGLSQGFDAWVCRELEEGPGGGSDPTADRIQRLAQAALGAPREGALFLFLNFMDPHTPWIVREPFLAHPDKIRPKTLPGTKGWNRASRRLLVEGTLPDETIESWSEAYDSEVRFLDDELGNLLAALPSLGIGPEDYVFILSDHGEYLGEHGLVQHWRDAYEELAHVPLLISGPGYAPGRDPTPLQHHDLAAMILAAAGLPPLPESSATGVQVTESWYARKDDLADPKLAPRFNRIRRGFVSGTQKLLLGDDGTQEAYDLAADPGELHPLTDAPWAETLQALATAWQAAQVPPEPATLDEPVNTEALRALGYVQ